MPSSPSARPEGQFAFLKAQPYAHRGLHGDGIIENSRAAFRAAIAAGHGVELDVQLSRDGVPMVFHDDELDRLTRETGPLARRDAAELGTIRLRGESETIPRLTEVLTLIAGRKPVLVEIKADSRRVGPLCVPVRRALDQYLGPAAVMSFNPFVCHWFAANAPRVVRGLIVTQQQESGAWQRARGLVTRLAAMARARPDFLACDVRDLPTLLSRSARRRNTPVLTWTVRSDDDRRIAAACADQPIYENAA